MDKLYDSETGCCPRFDPGPWNEKEIVFKDELFLKDHVLSFFHIPLTMNKVMKKDVMAIQDAKALREKPLMLFDENSLFGADVYIGVSKDVPGYKMVRISGTFLSKAYEGSFKDMGKWIKDMQDYAKSKNKEIKKLYFFYTTCPACAKYYGKNYTVILAKIK